MSLRVYAYEKCDTCRKALKFQDAAVLRRVCRETPIPLCATRLRRSGAASAGMFG